MIHFTSDTHFFHKGIVTKMRHWATSVEHMHEIIIEVWNRHVQPGDDVYHTGDLSFAGLAKTAAVVERLNGNLHIVPGNHEDDKVLRGLTQRGLIRVLPPLYYLTLGNGLRFVLAHFPQYSWNHQQHGSIQLHGHEHGFIKETEAFQADIGIDTHPEHRPYTLAEVLDMMKVRPGTCRGSHQPGAASFDAPR